MIELSRHIEILLLENDCVIVPGFGGFMAHHRPAEYVEEEGMFYPPQRTLGFNPQLTLNDSILAQSYVEAYDISYPEAVRRIEDELEEIKQLIAIEGEYEFHGIGTIKQKADGYYDFEPCAAGILSPSLYALNSYVISAISEKPQTIDMAVTGIGNTVADVKNEDAAVPQPIVADSEAEKEQTFNVDDEQDDIFTLRMRTLRRISAAAMLLMLLAFTIIPIPAGKGSSNVTTCSIVNTNSAQSLHSDSQMTTDNAAEASEEETLASEEAEVVEASNETKETVIAPVIAPEVNAKQEAKPSTNGSIAKGTYTIVLASKISQQGAEEYVASLKKEGYKDVFVLENGNSRKVVFGKFTKETDALESLRDLRDADERFALAWIAKN